MSDHVCPDGPFQVTLTVFGTDGEDTTSKAEYTLPNGRIPTREEIVEGLKSVREAIKPHGHRLMTRHEFVREQLPPGNFAIPGPDEFEIKLEARMTVGSGGLLDDQRPASRKCIGCGEPSGEPHRSECGCSRFLGDTVKSDDCRTAPPLCLTLNELRGANAKRQWEWDSAATVDAAYRGNELAGEVGEVCNVVKKLERERLGIRGSRATVEQLAEELGDVIICVDLLAMKYGIDLSKATRDKFNKTSEAVGLETRL